MVSWTKKEFIKTTAFTIKSIKIEAGTEAEKTYILKYIIEKNSFILEELMDEKNSRRIVVRHMFINNKSKINIYRIIWFLLILTFVIIFITLFLFPLHSGKIGLIWNKIILPFEMALFPIIFIWLKLYDFLYQEKERSGEISFNQKIITLLGFICCLPWCVMILVQKEGPIHAIQDLAEGPVTEILSFSSIYYIENYNHLIHTQPYFYLWMSKNNPSSNPIIMKLEKRNFTMIDQLCKNLVVDNVTWDTKNIMNSHKMSKCMSIYTLEPDIKNIPYFKVTYYPKSMILVSINYD